MRRSSSAGGKLRAAAADWQRHRGGDWRSVQGSLRVCSPQQRGKCRAARICVAERGSSRVWKNTQAGGRVAASRRAAVSGSACRREAMRRDPGKRFLRAAGPGENGDRNGAEDVLPPTPIWELHEVVATHQPHKSRPREAPAQRQQRVGRIGGAEPGLDVADPDARGRRRRCSAAWRSRSANGAMPAAGFSGFCGDTSHQTSSSPSRASASRLICRCPPCAGLNEPPSSPMRRARQQPRPQPSPACGGEGRLRAIAVPDFRK